MFEGYIVALITPFKNGKLDMPALEKLVDWHANEGTKGIVIGGTTGESPTLHPEELGEAVRVALNTAQKRIPILAGTGSNSTEKTIQLTQLAEKAGADGALIVSPYYNKPTQEGLFQHYQAVHNASNLPIVLYNVPGRTSGDIQVDTVVRLSKLPRIVGIKDASADLTRPVKTRKACGPTFRQLSGEDAIIVPFLAQGGHGCISVTANVAPRLCAELYDAWTKGDQTKVEQLNDKLMPLHQVMFVETNPLPAKYACAKMGFVQPEWRLPLCPPSTNTQQQVDKVLADLGIV